MYSFSNGKTIDYVTYILINNIFANLDDQGYNTYFIQAIVDHHKTKEVINK